METTDYCFSFFRKPIQNIEPIRAVGGKSSVSCPLKPSDSAPLC